MPYSHDDSPLVAIIRETINQQSKDSQAISFREFMELCLYHPQYGYYTSFRPKVGKEGDFYTSSSVGTVMGEMLAKFFATYFEQERGKRPFELEETFAITEWGAGTGKLAKQIMDELHEAFPELYQILRYTLIERSPHHRKLLMQELSAHHDKMQIVADEEWCDMPEPSQYEIVFSNELLDAFAVERFKFHAGTMHEIGVTWDDEAAQFVETLLVDKENALNFQRYLQDRDITPLEGQIFERNPAAAEWIARVGKRMRSGLLVTIDYGDVAEEIYSEHRLFGTLMCYRNHTAHDRPYEAIGEQDLTAHVDFTACIEAGLRSGFSKWTLQTQKEFLLAVGILDKLRDDPSGDPFSSVARKNRAIRQLLLGDRMSEVFKVLVQEK